MTEGRRKVSIARVETFSIRSGDVQGTYPAKVVAMGSGYWTRIPMELVRFWELVIGDELLVQISKVKRIRREEK